MTTIFPGVPSDFGLTTLLRCRVDWLQGKPISKYSDHYHNRFKTGAGGGGTYHIDAIDDDSISFAKYVQNRSLLSLLWTLSDLHVKKIQKNNTMDVSRVIGALSGNTHQPGEQT